MNEVNNYRTYIAFCRKFHNRKLPKMKFRKVNEHYKQIFRNEYDINREDIDKATFIIFIFSFTILFFISLIFLTNLSVVIILSYSFIISIIFAYLFNLRIYKIIYKDEIRLNALLYLIKLYFSLLQKSLLNDSDFALIFIKLIKGYNLSISKTFKVIMKRIQEGSNPERELSNFVSPSKDLNKYIRELIANNFKNQINSAREDTNVLEDKFKIYLKQIETRLSIIFFTGLFFPLGLGFLLLFSTINVYFLALLVPAFFLLQKILYKKFIKSDIFLLGLLTNYNKNEKKIFEEFLSFLKYFALNLQNNLSPEKAFIKSYFSHKEQLIKLTKPLDIQVNRLLNLNSSFTEMMEFLQYELKSFRYWIIIDVLKKMLVENAFESSKKIVDLLEFISKHRKLEKKLEIIMKGEKFKVLLFFFLLPIIMGAIGGMFPLFVLIIDLNSLNNMSYINFIHLITSHDFLITFSSLLACNLISSFYFLKIISYERVLFLILISSILYIIIFFIALFNILILI
ncbi:MAG: hypothetical protein ACFFEO_07995 [Candidatus Thorarchaeota archaeon]